jgi:hypothetical protein
MRARARSAGRRDSPGWSSKQLSGVGGRDAKVTRATHDDSRHRNRFECVYSGLDISHVTVSEI